MNILKARSRKPELSFEKATSAPSSVPTLAEASPEYAALLGKKAKIYAELSTVEREINDTMERLSRVSSEEALLKKARVDAILSDNGDEQSKRLGTQRDTLGRSLSELRERASDLKEALAEIEYRLNDARNRASLAICAEIEPQYRQLVVTMCERLRDLHEANLAYHWLVADLNAEDIAWTRLVPMHLNFLGAPYNHQSYVGHYLREAAAHGFISRDDVPEEFK